MKFKHILNLEEVAQIWEDNLRQSIAEILEARKVLASLEGLYLTTSMNMIRIAARQKLDDVANIEKANKEKDKEIIRKGMLLIYSKPSREERRDLIISLLVKGNDFGEALGRFISNKLSKVPEQADGVMKRLLKDPPPSKSGKTKDKGIVRFILNYDPTKSPDPFSYIDRQINTAISHERLNVDKTVSLDETVGDEGSTTKGEMIADTSSEDASADSPVFESESLANMLKQIENTLNGGSDENGILYEPFIMTDSYGVTHEREGISEKELMAIYNNFLQQYYYILNKYGWKAQYKANPNYTLNMADASDILQVKKSKTGNLMKDISITKKGKENELWRKFMEEKEYRNPKFEDPKGEELLPHMVKQHFIDKQSPLFKEKLGLGKWNMSALRKKLKTREDFDDPNRIDDSGSLINPDAVFVHIYTKNALKAVYLSPLWGKERALQIFKTIMTEDISNIKNIPEKNKGVYIEVINNMRVDPDFRYLIDRMQYAYPYAMADQAKGSYLTGDKAKLEWTQLTPEIKKEIADHILKEYYSGYNEEPNIRGLTGIPKHNPKGKNWLAPLITDMPDDMRNYILQVMEHAYGEDEEPNVRSPFSTWSPRSEATRAYVAQMEKAEAEADEKERLRLQGKAIEAYIINKLIRVAKILEFNSRYSEADVVDGVINEYVKNR